MSFFCELFQSFKNETGPIPRALPWAGICERLRRCRSSHRRVNYIVTVKTVTPIHWSHKAPCLKRGVNETPPVLISEHVQKSLDSANNCAYPTPELNVFKFIWRP